jgi:hypothetical protein
MTTHKQFKFRHASELAGTFVILSLLLLLAGIFFAAHYQGWFEGKFQLRTKFTTDQGSFGLQEGNEVRIRNTVAGKVGKIMPTADGGLETTFVIKKRFRPFVRKDSVAKVKMKFGVAGDAFIEIGMGKGAMVKDGDFIECKKDEEIMEIAKKALGDLRSSVVPMLDEVQGILKHVNGITGSINEGEGIAGSLLNDKEFAGEMKSTVGHLNTVLVEARNTFHETTRLIKGAQKTWLLRKHIETEDKQDDITVPWQYLSEADADVNKARYAAELEKARIADDSAGIVRNDCGLGMCLLAEHNYDELKSLLEEAAAEAGASGENAARVALLKAELTRVTGQALSAAETAESAAKLLDKSASDDLRAYSCLVAAAAYVEAGKAPEAESQLKKAEKYLKKASPALRAMAANLTGRALLLKGQLAPAALELDKESALLKEAELHFGMAQSIEQAGQVREKAGSPAIAADRYFRAGRSYFSAGNVSLATGALNRAMTAAKAAGDASLQTRIELLQNQIINKDKPENGDG